MEKYLGIWKYFDHHEICMQAKSNVGHRCLFCQLRSISLRLNRAKRRVNLKPVEILSQQDQLPKSNSTNHFPEYFYELLEKIGNEEDSVNTLLLGKSVFCKNCSLCKTHKTFKNALKCFILDRNCLYNQFLCLSFCVCVCSLLIFFYNPTTVYILYGHCVTCKLQCM